MDINQLLVDALTGSGPAGLLLATFIIYTKWKGSGSLPKAEIKLLIATSMKEFEDDIESKMELVKENLTSEMRSNREAVINQLNIMQVANTSSIARVHDRLDKKFN